MGKVRWWLLAAGIHAAAFCAATVVHEERAVPVGEAALTISLGAPNRALIREIPRSDPVERTPLEDEAPVLPDAGAHMRKDPPAVIEENALRGTLPQPWPLYNHGVRWA